MKYTKEHEWVLIESSKAIVGITAHAAEQLGDLDQHPVVARRGEDGEERRRERQEVLGVLARELADHVDRRADDRGVAVGQLLLQLGEGGPQRVRVLEDALVQQQHAPLAYVRRRAGELAHDVGDQVAREVGRHDVRQRVERQRLVDAEARTRTTASA